MWLKEFLIQVWMGGIAGIGVFTALLLVTSFVAVFIRFVQTLL